MTHSPSTVPPAPTVSAPTAPTVPKQTETVPEVPGVVPVVSSNGTDSGVAFKGTEEGGTPSPVVIQYVFIREPTMAPTNGVDVQSTLWMWSVTVLVMVWTLF